MKISDETLLKNKRVSVSLKFFETRFLQIHSCQCSSYCEIVLKMPLTNAQLLITANFLVS